MKHIIGLVEDEKDLGELVKSYLEREGYVVNVHTTYQSGLACVNDDVSMWILDIMLDEKSGFDLLEKIRAVKPSIPVIFMSARDQEFDRIIGLEKGSDDYITKPFSPKELVLRVNNVLKRVYKEGFSILEIDGYIVDENQRKVFSHQMDLELTTKEFDLLILFVIIGFLGL